MTGGGRAPRRAAAPDRLSSARTTLLVVLLTLVASIRFDYADPGPVRRLTAGAHGGQYGHPIDVEGYIRLTRFFRGEAPADSMIAPFCFRPLVPAVAALLPFRPLTAINVLNLASLVGALLLLLRTMELLGLGWRSVWSGGLLFALSFPAFYYTAIGFVDPVAILLVCGLFFLVLRDVGLAPIALVAATAALVKETNILFATLPGIYRWARGNRSTSDILRGAVPLATAAAAVAASRALLPFHGAGYHWSPSVTVLFENLSRPRTYLSLALTIGPPALLALLTLVSGKWRSVVGSAERRLLAWGILAAAALYGYSVASAYTDGRIIWIAYPFLIPMASAWFGDPIMAATPPARVNSK